MARPTLFKHPKFQRLVYLLRQPVPHVLGYLECLWHVCYEVATDLLGDEIDVELACQWPGEKGELCALLLQVGLLDRDADGKYRVHDLLDHAPDYVKLRMKREEARRVNGHTISEMRAEAGRKGGLARASNCRTAACDAQANEATPLPNPTQPIIQTPPTPLPGGEVVAPTPEEAPRKKPRGKPAEWDGTLPADLDSPEFRDAWARWEADRKARRKPLTCEARKLQWKQCERWGVAGAVRSIDASIAAGWQGLFDPPAARAAGTGQSERERRDAARRAKIREMYKDLPNGVSS